MITVIIIRLIIAAESLPKKKKGLLTVEVPTLKYIIMT